MKRILLLLFAAFALIGPALAQSMTDDQIVSYILQEKEREIVFKDIADFFKADLEKKNIV